jgi:DNA-binding NarL/FixJ family response regulator
MVSDGSGCALGMSVRRGRRAMDGGHRDVTDHGVDRLRVILADDNYLVRQGTAALLATSSAVELVRAVDDPASLLAAVEELRPDAVLTDIRMPPTFSTEGLDAAKRIRSEHPGIGVVVLSQYSEEEYVFDLLADGVAGLGYLLKERVSDVDELVRALNEVSRGGSALDAQVVERLLSRRSAETSSPLVELSDREREVLGEMATGRSNAGIAQALFMSERAVERHITAVFQKLGLGEEIGLNRRVSAVLAFLEAGGEPPSRPG